MNLINLNHLLTVLRRVRDERLALDMTDWVNLDHPCGTAFCAAGYAALDPNLQADGLRLQALDEEDDVISDVKTVADIARVQAIDGFDAFGIAYRDTRGFPSLAKCFGITDGTARYLFLPSTYIYMSSNSDSEIKIDTVIGRLRTLMLDGEYGARLDEVGYLTVEVTGLNGGIRLFSPTKPDTIPHVRWHPFVGNIGSPHVAVTIADEPTIDERGLSEVQAQQPDLPCLLDWVKMNQKVLMHIWREGHAWTRAEFEQHVRQLRRCGE